MSSLLECQELNAQQRLEIMELWNQEYPQRISYSHITAFDVYLTRLEDAFHVLSLDDAGKIMAWYCDFNREGERWLAMILASSEQGKGLGSTLLQLAKKRQSLLNAWVVDHNTDLKKDGTIYRSPLAFYQKNGFEIVEGVRLETPQISSLKMRWRKDFP